MVLHYYSITLLHYYIIPLHPYSSLGYGSEFTLAAGAKMLSGLVDCAPSYLRELRISVSLVHGYRSSFCNLG